MMLAALHTTPHQCVCVCVSRPLCFTQRDRPLNRHTVHMLALSVLFLMLLSIFNCSLRPSGVLLPPSGHDCLRFSIVSVQYFMSANSKVILSTPMFLLFQLNL